MTLRDLQMGESAVITTVGGRGALRQHFLDMGMIPGVQVTLVKYAPMGDPMELRLHGYELTLRLADAEQIEIEEVQKAGAEYEASKAGKGGRLKESGRFTDQNSVLPNFITGFAPTNRTQYPFAFHHN